MAELDMTDTAILFPSNLMLQNEANLHTSIPKTSEAAYTSVYYPTHTPYCHVCGMIKANPSLLMSSKISPKTNGYH